MASHMLKKYSQLWVASLFVLDIIIISLSWNLAYFARFIWINYPQTSSSIPAFEPYLQATLLVIIFAILAFAQGKMYQPQRITHSRTEIPSIFHAMIVLFVLLLAASFFYRGFSFSRVQSIYFLIIATILISLNRKVIRFILTRARAKGKNLRNILIIGNQNTAQRFTEKIQANGTLGFQITGYVFHQDEHQMQPYLGTYEQLPQIIEKNGIDQIYIALDSDQQSDLKTINRYLAEQTVDVNIVPDIFNSLNINPEVLDLDGVPVITLRQSPLSGWNRIIKRIFDIIGSSVALLLLIPFWVVIPILIRLSSPGPIFYKQERMGLDGKKFNIIKFRSMRTDAESSTGAVWATKGDDRTTALGAFMRKTSIDELPQFFNVLTGEMSLVGPRPERPEFIEKFKYEIPNYMLRHKTKAGITGWAQANGWRGNTSLEKRIEFDLYYIANWSIWFDIKILIMTVFTGFVNKNAY